jgi:hypothetical protein
MQEQLEGIQVEARGLRPWVAHGSPSSSDQQRRGLRRPWQPARPPIRPHRHRIPRGGTEMRRREQDGERVGG